jgi:hypothetical protein
LILFASLMIRYFTQLGEPGRTAQDKAQGFINILIIAVTIVVVAVRESLFRSPSARSLSTSESGLTRLSIFSLLQPKVYLLLYHSL